MRITYTSVISKTFFDGHKHMEYNYTNNIRFVEACENTVSTFDPEDTIANLSIYPNPTKEEVRISV